MKFIFAIFILFFVFFQQSFAQDNIQNVLKIQSYTFDEQNQIFTLQQYGSAIVYKKDIILTNAHVILDESTQKPVGNYRVCKTIDFKKSPDCTLTAQLLYYDIKNDLAALKIAPQNQTISLSKKDLKITDGVKVLGYPSNGGETITYTEGKISGYEDELYKVDANIDAGNSGGGVFDDQNNLIGMSVSVRVGYSTLGYIIPLETIEKFFAKKTKNIVEVKAVVDRKFSQFVHSQKTIAAGKSFSNAFFEIKDYKKYKLTFHEYLMNQKNEYFVTSFYDSTKATSLYVYNIHTEGNTQSLINNLYKKNITSEKSQEGFQKITGKKQKLQGKNSFIFYSYYDDGSVYAQVVYELSVNDYLTFSIYSENGANDTSFLNVLSLVTKGITLKNIQSKNQQSQNMTGLKFKAGNNFVLVKNLYDTQLVSTKNVFIEMYGETLEKADVSSKSNIKNITETLLSSFLENTFISKIVYKKTLNGTPYVFLVGKNNESKDGEKVLGVDKYFAIVFFYHKTQQEQYVNQRILFTFSEKSDLDDIEKFIENISVDGYQSIEIGDMKEGHSFISTPDFEIK